MMKFILAALLFCSGSLYAQYDLPQSEQAKAYGTIAERTQQDAIQAKSKSGYLCRLIGFKGYYLNKIAAYLQSDRDFYSDDVPNKPGVFVYSFTKKAIQIGNDKHPKLTFKFAVNKSDRIKSGVVTGAFEDLADLFINYWPMDADWISEVRLKPGVVAQKHSFGDLISFRWSAEGKPYITVTADPNISFPLATR